MQSVRTPMSNRSPRLDDIVARGLNLTLAIRCVELARLAYATPERGERQIRQTGYLDFAAMKRREGRDYLFVTADDRYRYVVIRGSDKPSDWLTNLSMWTTGTTIGRVHSGYYGVAVAFMEELEQRLRAMPDRPIVLTGHSMGGAVAVITAMMLQAGNAIAGVYTFGQPKAGRHSFSQALERAELPYYRFVHGRDAIALWGLGSNSLAGTACYFDIRGRLAFGENFGEIPRVKMRFHRLAEYRHLLRLNQLKLQSLEQLDETVIEP